MSRSIILTGAALIALWGLSFGLSFVDLGHAGLPVAMAIAAGKAVLVGAIFMELASASTSIRLTVLTAGALAALLIGLVVADMREREPAPLVVPGYDSAVR